MGLEGTWWQSCSSAPPASPGRLLAAPPLALRTPFHSGTGEGSCLNIVPVPLKRYQVNELQTPPFLPFLKSPGSFLGCSQAAATLLAPPPLKKGWERALDAPKHLRAGHTGVLGWGSPGAQGHRAARALAAPGARGICSIQKCSWGLWMECQCQPHPTTDPRALGISSVMGDAQSSEHLCLVPSTAQCWIGSTGITHLLPGRWG